MGIIGPDPRAQAAERAGGVPDWAVTSGIRLPEGLDPETPCVRVHSALPNGTVPTHYVALSDTEDGGVALPFVNLDGTLFLREIGGELIAMQFVHRIEGLPEPAAQSGD